MENTQAPIFKTSDHTGATIDLANMKGKKVLLYFYPKDSTPGCTIEALGFQDLYREFKKHNTEIFAVSKDSQEKHQNFCNKQGLDFPILMDTEAVIIQQYNVWKEKSMFGKKYMGISRESFLIDENGMIIKHWNKVKPLSHPQEVLDFIINKKQS